MHTLVARDQQVLAARHVTRSPQELQLENHRPQVRTVTVRDVAVNGSRIGSSNRSTKPNSVSIE